MTILPEEKRRIDYYARVMNFYEYGSAQYKKAVEVRAWLVKRIINRERNEELNVWKQK